MKKGNSLLAAMGVAAKAAEPEVEVKTETVAVLAPVSPDTQAVAV